MRFIKRGICSNLDEITSFSTQFCNTRAQRSWTPHVLKVNILYRYKNSLVMYQYLFSPEIDYEILFLYKGLVMCWILYKRRNVDLLRLVAGFYNSSNGLNDKLVDKNQWIIIKLKLLWVFLGWNKIVCAYLRFWYCDLWT